MAVTSGSCYSSYAKNTRFRIDWERTGTWSDNSGCGSIIKWKLVLENGNYWYSNAIKCYAIYINGTKVSDGGTWSNYTSSGNYDLIGWQTGVRIAHNNAGNEKTFNINYTGWFYSSYNVSASTDFTLPSIPRGTSITSFAASKRNETSLTLTWKTADAIAEVYYSTNNGTNWTKDSATNVSSGTITASGLSPNTTYQCKLKVIRNTIETLSSQVSQTTYKVPTQALSSKTETSITMSWSIDSTASQIRYSSNNGSSWSNWINVSGTSGTYTISGLSANTGYNIKTEVKRSATGTSYPTSASSQTTYNYPYLVSANSFVIGDNILLNLYNPLNRSLTIYLKGNDNSVINTATRTVNGDTWIGNSSQEILDQYASIPNSQTGSYKVRIVCSALSRDTTVNGNTYSVNTSYNIPDFSNFEYKDTASNDLVTAIDNDQVLVQSVSDVNVVISSANKMVAKHSATPKSYYASFSNLGKSINYSSSDIDENLGVITGNGNLTFKVTAYDSRSIPKEVSKSVNVIAYTKPSITVKLQRTNNFEAETKIKVNGTFTRVTIDNEDKNLIKTVRYRYKESSSGTWGSWATMTIASQGSGSYQTSEETLTFDNTKQYDFQFETTDRAKTVTVAGILSIGEPLMFLHTSGKLEVNGEVQAKKFRTKNLFDKNLVLKNYEMLQTGTVTPSSGWFVTNFIEVKPNTQYTISGKDGGYTNCFYTEDKVFVSKVTGILNGTITTPSDNTIKYMRTDTKLTQIDLLQIEEGSNATAYSQGQEMHLTEATTSSSGLMSAADKIMLNSIVESGSNSNGSYIKYIDGTMICYGIRTFKNVVIQTQWGSFYETATTLDFGKFPATFIAQPITSFHAVAGSSVFVEAITSGTSSIGSTWLSRPKAEDNVPSVSIAFMAIGKWK